MSNCPKDRHWLEYRERTPGDQRSVTNLTYTKRSNPLPEKLTFRLTETSILKVQGNFRPVSKKIL